MENLDFLVMMAVLMIVVVVRTDVGGSSATFRKWFWSVQVLVVRLMELLSVNEKMISLERKNNLSFLEIFCSMILNRSITIMNK